MGRHTLRGQHRPEHLPKEASMDNDDALAADTGELGICGDCNGEGELHRGPDAPIQCGPCRGYGIEAR